ARDQQVLDFLRQRRIPVALSMAGGYGRELSTTVACQVATLEAAARSWQLWQQWWQPGDEPNPANALPASPGEPFNPNPMQECKP
ncbi:MAG: hypothetical protein K2W93_15105, partial [Burkholderiaceae bacterium]|nr:hypothetical protein [Burkholderiaceae bacterium]